jgi:hypothetical protein
MTTRLVSLLPIVLVAACEVAPELARGSELSAADAGADAAAACSALTPELCAYVPPVAYAVGPERLAKVRYVDILGSTREIQIEVRTPLGAANAPVVVWSHGGAEGKRRAHGVGREWGRVFNEAGYVSVHIAHVGRSTADDTAVCNALGLSGCGAACASSASCTAHPGGECIDSVCHYYKPLNWDRPNDVGAVLDWIETEAAAGGHLAGVVDVSRIAYAGHSAGAGSAMMVAGASRTYGDSLERVLADERPIAFVSCSPQGVGEDGFTAASFDASACLATGADARTCLGRPHLFLTGAGDDTNGVTAETRRDPYDLAPAGDKHLFWILEEAARHGTFELDPGPCTTYSTGAMLDPARCLDYEEWLSNVMVAFLDAHVRALPDAALYLESTAPSDFAGGAADWTLR